MVQARHNFRFSSRAEEYPHGAPSACVDNNLGCGLPSTSRECRQGGTVVIEPGPTSPPGSEAAENHGATTSPARDRFSQSWPSQERATSPTQQAPTIAPQPAPTHSLAECQDDGGGTVPATEHTGLSGLRVPPVADAPRFREADLIIGAQRLGIAHELLRLVDLDGLSQREAARRIGVSAKAACLSLQILRAHPEATAEDFAPRRCNSGRKPVLRLEDPEVRAALRRLIQTNLNATSGSRPHALKLAAADGALRPEVVELVRSRMADGRTPLPPAAMRQLRLSETVVRGHRSPRNAWLDYVASPGSLHVTVDEESGDERLVQPGEWWTIDDGSINLLCIVPGLERPGDACWDRWGVAVGRFQLLLTVDHRTRMIVGWSYTARPRDSYRAEDIVATLHNAAMQHGAPRAMILEHGVSAAGLVSQTLQALGVRIQRASSPHQKVVESVFNALWTRLSTLPGQVGRFRGEEEACNKMLRSIRDGALDPRGRLISLNDLVVAMRAWVADFNATPVNSERLGRWVPADLWAAHAAPWLRRISAEDSWIFAPVVSQPIKVRGNRVETSWQPMPGWTVKLVFAADWLLDFHGVRVVLRYNPHAPECEAVAILSEQCGERRPGTMLGRLVQIDRLARMTRRALGYGIDPDIGLEETRSAAQAMRRHVEAVRSDGAAGVQTHEIRTGAGTTKRIEISTNTQTESVTHPARGQAPTGDVARVAGPGRVGQRPGSGRSGTRDLAGTAQEDARLAEFLDEDA